MLKYDLFYESRAGGYSFNQDRVAFAKTDESLLCVVADGLGGHCYGEVAAQVVVDCFIDSFRKSANPKISMVNSFLMKTVHHANDLILQQSAHDHLENIPHTTVVVCLIQDSCAYWLHCGDSRLYLFRGVSLLKKTCDHSKVQRLVELGVLSESLRCQHPERNKITSCLGLYRLGTIDYSGSVSLEPDDIIVLCTDGFWEYVTADEILSETSSQSIADFSFSMKTLMDCAEKRGGEFQDNCSLIGVRVLLDK